MTDLRVLTDVELDIVAGGKLAVPRPEPTQCDGGELKLAEEILAVLFRVLEPKQPVMRRL
jgi:hypothetical protein